MPTNFWKPTKGKMKKEGSDKLSPVANLIGEKTPSSQGASPMKAEKFKFMSIRKRNPKTVKVFSIVLGVLLALGLSIYFFLVKPGLEVAKVANNLKGSVGLVQSGFTNRDLIQMRQGFDEAEKGLEDLRLVRDKKFGWVSKIGFFRSYYNDSEYAIAAAEHAILAGRELATLSEPFADAIGLRISEDQEPTQLSLIDAISSWVSIMPQLATDIDSVLSELSLAGEFLEKIDPQKYPEKIKGVEIRSNLERAQKLLTSLNESGPDLKKALVLIPRLLGTDNNELRYMIIMQNDKEIRPTGGFWTNYATFKIKNAMLNSDFSSHDMYSIDEALSKIDAWYDFPDAPEPYATYLKVQHLYAPDANYSPDFPTSVEKFMEFYDMAISVEPLVIKPVDGVFSIDTVVLEELMEITGPVTVGGITYSSENVVLELEKLASLTLKEQVGRKAVLGNLMQAMLINVFESDNNLWPSLIEKGVDLAMRKHIMVYMKDPEIQELLKTYNFAGTVSEVGEGEDYAYLVSTNLGGDKTNWFVKKKVTHKLQKDGDRWLRTVVADFTYEQPDNDHAVFGKRYQDWLRLYVPEGSELIESSGFDTRLSGGNELQKTFFDGFFTLSPGENRQIVFKYHLPQGFDPFEEEGLVLESTGSSSKLDSKKDKSKKGIYRLIIQKQPGVKSEVHSVEIPGYSEEITLTKDVVFKHTLVN